MHKRLSRGPGGAAIGLLAGVLAISGCGSAGQPGSASRAATVNVMERDFHISAPAHARAGTVHLAIHNDGPDRHELIVVRENGSPLPLRSDGLTVNEDRIEHAKVGGIEPSPPAGVRDLNLNLAPGRYILFCNMSGHYLGGMHSELVVAPS